MHTCIHSSSGHPLDANAYRKERVCMFCCTVPVCTVCCPSHHWNADGAKRPRSIRSRVTAFQQLTVVLLLTVRFSFLPQPSNNFVKKPPIVVCSCCIAVGCKSKERVVEKRRGSLKKQKILRMSKLHGFRRITTKKNHRTRGGKGNLDIYVQR